MIMARDPVSAKLMEILLEDRERARVTALAQMKEMQQSMDKIRKTSADPRSRTLTGSLLASLGIERKTKGKLSECELNFREIMEREAKWPKKGQGNGQTEKELEKGPEQGQDLGQDQAKNTPRVAQKRATRGDPGSGGSQTPPEG